MRGHRTLTAQEKFLEFSLYNLSNFVAPVATDVIDIVATPTLMTWATPAPIYYGTPLGANAVECDSDGLAGSNHRTRHLRLHAAAGTILPVGTDTLNAVFTPSDPDSLHLRQHLHHHQRSAGHHDRSRSPVR